MRSLIMGLVALLCVGVESTVLPGIALRGIIPNLSLILVVSYAALRGSQSGRCLGLFIGLIQDVLYFTTIGFYGLIYYLIGQLCGYFCRDVNRENYVLPLAVILAADILYCFVNYVFLYLLKGELQIGYFFLRRALPEISYTGLAALPAYALVNLLNKGVDTLTAKIRRRKSYKEG